VNKQTEPVDVLAVMGHAIESAGKMVKASNGDFRAVIYQDDLFKARAAIAELIEAADALSKCYPEHSPIYHVIQLRAALAAVSPK
jgi:hypothetical protein